MLIDERNAPSTGAASASSQKERKNLNNTHNLQTSFADQTAGAPPPPPNPPSPSPLHEAARRAAAASAAVVLSASVLLGAPTLDAHAAAATAAVETSSSTTTYRLPVVSPDPDVLSVQRVLLQAWDIVDRAFVDGSFGGRDRGSWTGDLVDSLDAAAGAGAAGGGGGARLAELAIDAMLDRLGDPYTRRMPARDYAAFRQSSEGEIAGGVGLLIAAQPVVRGDEENLDSSSSPPLASAAPSSLTNSTRLRSRLVVLSPIEGGPAARAGIRPGDEVLAIDGHPTDGFDGESAAGLLRGPRGSSVVVDVARREVEEGTTGEMMMVPGIPGRAPKVFPSVTTMSVGDGKKKNAAGTPRVSVRQVRLRREKVELSPVTSAVLPVDRGKLSSSSNYKKIMSKGSSPLEQEEQQNRQQQQHKVGYLRLASFNARAAPDTAKALEEMRRQGAEAFVLDLRGNGGGLVRAAVDVSRALLPRGSTVFAVQGRSDVGGGGEGGEENDDGSSVGGRHRRHRHHNGMGAMTPLASPDDVVSASSGIPSTAITKRVVLDDEIGSGADEGEEDGGGGVLDTRKKTGALARVMMMLPRLFSSPLSSSSESLIPSSQPLTSSSATPLAVLVDRNSASASEILAGALRDNGRAALVGDERTFGKGKIQSVFPLRDGSALFVTVARYVTPSEQPIDGVGILPENACRGAGGGKNASSASSSALLASLEMVPGVVAREAGALQASLSADSCVLTAERLLLAQVEKQQEQKGLLEGGGGTEERRL